jgi:protein-tyrosine phosphatase
MGFLSDIFKKKEPVSNLTDLSSLGIDMHSHLIPGVDDGAKTLADSIHLIRGLCDLGYHTLITSPHIMTGGYNNTPEIILRGRDMVREALVKENIKVHFDAWAEYYLDETIVPKIASKNLLTMGNNYILVELSYLIHSNMSTTYIKQLQQAGYKVVLAHPERYPYYFDDDLDMFRGIKDMGVYFQLNIGSLTGIYSKQTKAMAEKMIDNNFYTFVGTDLHNDRHLNYIRDAVRMPYMEKVLDYQGISNRALVSR